MEQTFTAVPLPEPIVVKVKKPKPIIRERHRRVKKDEIIATKKMIQEVGDNFRIQFPEGLEEKYAPLLMAISGAREAIPSRIPFDPTGLLPPEQVTWLRVYNVRVSEETLQLVYHFGKSNRFDFASDIAARAHAASHEGKELSKLSFAKSTSMLVLPKFPFNINPETGKRFKFFPFQEASILYALKTQKCFIADEMGVGKTISGLGTTVCDLPNVTKDGFKEPWLVIVPSSLRINWYKEFRRWLPRNRFSIAMIKNKNLKTHTVINRKTRVKREVLTKESIAFKEAHDVYIMTYDKIHRYAQHLQDMVFRGVIFDESHYLKSRSTKRIIAVKAFMTELDPQFILLLSGTPLMNKPMDLISQLQVQGRLADFGGFNHFVARYCALSTTDLTHVTAAHNASKVAVGLTEEKEGAKEPEELITKETIDKAMKDAMTRKVYENMIALNIALRSQCYVRREKADVLKDLPPKTRQTVALEISNRKDYEAVERDVVAFLADKAASDEKFLKSIERLKGDARSAAISAHRSTIAYKTSRAEALVRIEILKQTAAVGKLKATKEWIDNFLESGKKLVVFATHKMILNELESMYPDSLSIRSGMSPERRDEAVVEFQTNAKKKIIFIGLKLAVGLTLVAASDTLTVEFGWTPAVHDQAEDRVHRIGQKKNVVAYYHVAAGTIEEKIGTLIEKKRRVVNATADGDPLKGQEEGSVLGDLMQELTGSSTLY